MTASVRAIVVDLDGTIIDSAPAMAKVAGRFLNRLDLPPLSLEETRSFIGEGARAFCKKMLAAREIGTDKTSLDEHYELFLALYSNAPAEDNALFDGARETLRACVEKGVPLALCTNKPSGPTRKVLDTFGLAPLFGVIVDGDTMAAKKPDPRPLLGAVERIGTLPAETIFVGDSEIDAATAKAAAVPFALHTKGYALDVDAIAANVRFDDWRDFGGLLTAPAFARPG